MYLETIPVTLCTFSAVCHTNVVSKAIGLRLAERQHPKGTSGYLLLPPPMKAVWVCLALRFVNIRVASRSYIERVRRRMVGGAKSGRNCIYCEMNNETAKAVFSGSLRKYSSNLQLDFF